MTSSQSVMLTQAQLYADAGKRIFPLKVKEKQPAFIPGFNHGFKDATTSKEAIKKAWATTNFNIGLVTGEVNNLVVVDVDDEQIWRNFWANKGELPQCPKVTTGKGHHLYFAYPKGRQIRNKQEPGNGFDIRANGGYIVAPPSIHHSGKVYKFTKRGEPPELPEWLLELIAQPEKAANTPLDFNATITAANDSQGYYMKALDNECQAITKAPEGTRNATLNTASFCIGQLVAGGGIDEHVAREALAQAAQQCGLTTNEITKTINSGIQSGKANPRAAPETRPGNPSGLANNLTWDKPKELKAELLPVKPLDPEMLPDSMRDYITDIAERMDHSSPDYVAVGVMVALATLIGRKLAVMPKRYDPWLVVPNLWGAVIGRPSAKKTPSLTKAMAPLHQFESVEFENHGLAMGKYLEQVKVAKVALKANEKLLKKKIEGGKQEEGEKDFLKSLNLGPVEPPPCKRFIVNDATVEKLGELLGSNPMGVLLFRDELTGWLNTMDKPDRASDRAFYLECWAGTGSFTYDRIGRGTQRIESATLSLMGGIQPGKLMPYLVAQKEGKGDDGLIERFQLMVFPDPKPFEHVDRRPNEEAEQKAIQIFNKLNWLEGDLANPTILKFLPDAQKLFDTWYDKNQNLVRSATLSPQLESHLAKYVSLFPSLALIIHAVDSSPGGSIGIQSAKKALAWCEYLESHARRVYALADGPIGSAKALQKRLHNMPNPFRIGAINSKNWHGLTTTDQIHEALNSLCEHGHLQKVVSGTTRPATDYFKHPMYCNS